MPGHVAERIKRRADDALIREAPKLRGLLGVAALANDPMVVIQATNFDMDSLIHCIYFEDEWVIQRIATHIEKLEVKKPRTLQEDRWLRKLTG